MTANVGPMDRAMRIVLGLGLLSLLFLIDGNAKWLGLIGLVPLLTALARRCPLYTIVGISTCGAGGSSPEAR